MKKNLERFILKTPLKLSDVIDETIEMCEQRKREVIIVGGYFGFQKYYILKRMLKKRKFKGDLSYRIHRPESNLHYAKGPYFLEIDCFKIDWDN